MTRNSPRNKMRVQSSDTKPNPGDEAARGTPGTGEDICPQCNGSGRLDGGRCPNCGGRGKIVRGIGGA
jgi:DnaJ-class molecular chaperone